MQISTSALALAILGLTSALPVATVSKTATNGNDLCPSLPKGNPTGTPHYIPQEPEVSELEVPEPNKGGSIYPGATSQYDVWTGAVRYSESHGKIFKNGKTTDVTTLMTFTFPAESQGKTCSFHFDLSSNPDSEVSGTGQFDVFISQKPATQSAKSWPSGNLRDHHIGRMVVKSHEEAKWVEGFPVFGQSFPCPDGETYGGELVGVGDADHIEWLASSGPYISYQ